MQLIKQISICCLTELMVGGGYGMDHLDLHNPLTNSVIENIFKEYLFGANPVFTGNTAEIGTDEYAKKMQKPFVLLPTGLL